jgi:curved DNA-binding protein CbpA
MERLRMAKKQSLYEVLGVPNTAPYDAVREAHQQRVQALDQQQPPLGPDDYSLQLRVLNMAYSTLSAPSSRDAYDASLADVLPEPVAPAPPELALQTTSSSESALRAELLALRAETMALRADAISLKADALTRPGSYRPGLLDNVVMASGPAIPASTLLRTVLMTVGLVVALAMVMKLFFIFASGSPKELTGSQKAAADEKVFLQEYYQTYGVRPANRAEAAQLDAQRQNTRVQEQQAREAKEQQRASADQDRRFEEDSRRRAAQVATELELANERASRVREREETKDEQAKRRLQDAERERVETERRRAEADQERWRRIIVSPSRN